MSTQDRSLTILISGHLLLPTIWLIGRSFQSLVAVLKLTILPDAINRIGLIKKKRTVKMINPILNRVFLTQLMAK